jgi:hypothetical protein
VSPSGIPVLRLPASLLVYQPLVLVFAVITFLRVWLGRWDDQGSRQVALGLSLWALAAILIPILYAGRQVGDMVWALVPLWALAAAEISRATLPGQDRVTYLVSGGLGALLLVLAVVGWINLLSLGRYQTNEIAYWAIIIGALVLGFIAIFWLYPGQPRLPGWGGGGVVCDPGFVDVLIYLGYGCCTPECCPGSWSVHHPPVRQTCSTRPWLTFPAAAPV